jgi:hypothetical protein
MRRKIPQRELEAIQKQGVPVLRATYLTKSQIHVWCPYCIREHHHGIGGGKPFTPTHRSAHCHIQPESPFEKTGYFIFFTGKEPVLTDRIPGT